LPLAFTFTPEIIVHTLISKAIFLVFAGFDFFPPSPIITSQGIFVVEEDVFYN
jgi:hypothetical protein